MSNKQTFITAVVSGMIGAGTVMVTQDELIVDGKPPTYRAWVEMDEPLHIERGDTLAFDIYEKNMRLMLSPVEGEGRKWFMKPRSEERGVVQFKAEEAAEVK